MREVYSGADSTTAPADVSTKAAEVLDDAVLVEAARPPPVGSPRGSLTVSATEC
jgi:hypothetical protein